MIKCSRCEDGKWSMAAAGMRLDGGLENAAEYGNPVGKAKIRTVPITSLHTNQKYLDQDKVAQYIGTPKGMPTVVQHPNGELHVNDGNHRIVAAAARGEKTVKVRVFNNTWNPRGTRLVDGHPVEAGKKFGESTASPLESAVSLLEAKATLRGPMSLTAEVREKKFAKKLKAYFAELKAEVLKTNAATSPDKEHAAKEAERAVVDLSPKLRKMTEEHLADCMLAADKLDMAEESDFSEDDPAWPIDQLGLSGEEAAAWAEENAAQKVAGIDENTVDAIADIVSDGIKNLVTIDGIKKNIVDAIDEMGSKRAMVIARTETADAFGEAALRKLKRLDIEGKQLIPSPDACPICLEIALAGPVPVDEPFVNDDGDEFDRSPIHVCCRCATVGARLPDSADSDED